MADEYVYKDPNTDMMKALSKAVDAATGKTGTQYEYKNPDSDVIQKLEELIEAIATSGGGGGSGHNYSTTEHVVGTWIDGKPLYQKSFQITVSTSSYDVNVSDLNIDTFMFMPEASFKRATSDGNTVALGYYNDSNDKFQAYYRRNDKLIRIISVGSAYAGTGYITIQYTKSST